MTKQEVLDAANVMIAYANGKKVGTRPRRSMEPLLKILYVPTWNWEQKDYCMIPDDAAKESLEQSQGGQAVSATPRTDAARQDQHDPYMAVASECAKLERELNDMKRIAAGRLGYIQRLFIENDSMRADLLLWQEQEAK